MLLQHEARTWDAQESHSLPLLQKPRMRRGGGGRGGGRGGGGGQAGTRCCSAASFWGSRSLAGTQDGVCFPHPGAARRDASALPALHPSLLPVLSLLESSLGMGKAKQCTAPAPWTPHALNPGCSGPWGASSQPKILPGLRLPRSPALRQCRYRRPRLVKSSSDLLQHAQHQPCSLQRLLLLQ